ncbi:MAG: hypothetical protein N3F07_03905, partial [Candidatus Micrarchaeota archaeon]|nr:hypothetical protein [Candidatus Micrarchaeota archaeon]
MLDSYEPVPKRNKVETKAENEEKIRKYTNWIDHLLGEIRQYLGQNAKNIPKDESMKMKLKNLWFNIGYLYHEVETSLYITPAAKEQILI